MIFSSYSFLLFLIIVLVVYYILNSVKQRQLAKIWLVLASLYFYAQGSKSFLPFFIFNIFFNYGIGFFLLKIHKKWIRRGLLTVGLLENIALLGYFKYTDFFISNYNYVTGSQVALRNIILPIGISFFTFQLIAYLVDCYRNKTEEYSLINYLLFITFFPQLIVGPIVHHKDVVPQFQKPLKERFNINNIIIGLFIFSIGCAKKKLIADPLTGYAQIFFNNINEFGFFETWTSSIAFTISYYFDLSGYADMAIGLGLFFNIQLPQNFNAPYRARNFRDYWRRWHITLSKFLGDYVFRSIFKKGDSSRKFYFAIMVTFLVSGFWHGAGWQFVIWGIINGLFVCTAHVMIRQKWKLPYVLARFLTILGIIGTRIMFVVNGTSQAFTVYKKLFDFSQFRGLPLQGAVHELIEFLVFNAYTFGTLLVGIIIVFFGRTTQEMANNIDTKQKYKYAALAGGLLVVCLIQMSKVSDFLYFQF